MLLRVCLSILLLAPLNHRESVDTVLTAAVATATKTENSIAESVTRISAGQLEEYGVNNPKLLGAIVPGVHLPSYGASLTSSIYVRGLGSRMENPVIGLYVDDFPVLDKNSYDMDYLDLAEVRFLHGPQGTAYGRNAMMGVLSLHTRAPSGGERLEATLEYGSARHVKAGLSWNHGRHLFSAAYRHGAGVFLNEYKGSLADPYDGGLFRWRWEKWGDDSFFLSHLLQLGISSEGGFAYGLYRDGMSLPVSYNDEGRYRRFTLLEGVKLHYGSAHVHWEAMGSFQFLADHMSMDQDYTPVSVFTLQQKQLSPALTFELIARPAASFSWWKPVTGVFAFVKYNRTAAPVLFKEDGIRSLILDNANPHIPTEIGYLSIPDSNFPIDSFFDIVTGNVALYHESVFSVRNWKFSAGIRVDLESAVMVYDCTASLHYQLVGMMSAPRPFTDAYRGHLAHGAPVLLPRLGIEYGGVKGLRLFASAAKGYRAGGFNTQIFSDILQNRMMEGMMADMGVHLDIPTVSVGADKTEYQPEEAWNLEGGLSYQTGGFRATVSAFFIDVLRQQLTVFPPGKSTGRMMTNAGRSRSIGTQLEASYTRGGFHSRVSWGWNDARFLEFSDGNADYASNRVPYAPAHTLFAAAGYRWKRLSVEAHLRGTGPMAWNEANTLEEPFYLTAGAQVQLQLNRFCLYVRGENLSGTRYHAFYFKSMGNEFFQAGRPRSLLLGIKISIK